MSPFEQGRADAQGGKTACPYGVPYDARRWELGYDKERVNNPGMIGPRFAAMKRR